MADVLTQEQRRLCMSRNRGRDTRPEVVLRKACWAVGMRYRLHAKLPGSPDIAFPGSRLVVFVDGCFWHGCPEHYKAPATRSEYWKAKRETNANRDRKVDGELSALGWRVVRIWEHEIRHDLVEAVAKVAAECKREAAASHRRQRGAAVKRNVA